MSRIFGGSKSRSESRNVAFEQLNDQFAGVVDQGRDANNRIMALLRGDREGSGLNAFQRATGFDAMAEQGARGITGAGAARGMLRSGASGRALQAFGQNIQNQSAMDFVNALSGQTQTALGAGQIIAGAGARSDSSSGSTPGLSGFIGQAMSGAAALKTGGMSKAGGF
jgi:hypothetical protein